MTLISFLLNVNDGSVEWKCVTFLFNVHVTIGCKDIYTFVLGMVCHHRYSLLILPCRFAWVLGFVSHKISYMATVYTPCRVREVWICMLGRAEQHLLNSYLHKYEWLSSSDNTLTVEYPRVPSRRQRCRGRGSSSGCFEDTSDGQKEIELRVPGLLCSSFIFK